MSEQYTKQDFDQDLYDLLQEEIWKEVTLSTGKTREDLDREIIEELKKIATTLDEDQPT